MSALIESVDLHRLRVPLERPYHLSFTTLVHFDLFLVRVTTGDREGLGDCVPLPGYSHENADGVWRSLTRAAHAASGRGVSEALAALERVREQQPFATAPLMSAIETATAPQSASQTAVVALLGTVTERADEEVERLLAAGYETLKVKVGWDPAQDARWVGRVQEIVAGRALLRLDANQAYDVEQARLFVEHVDPTGIEVFEQPFGPDAWEQTTALSAASRLPIMLDESIESEADLERMIELGAAPAVKFKLGKAGGLEALERLIGRARSAGLRVVLGNGVAGDLENLHELRVAARLIDTAGEMNGFLKPARRLLSNPYEVANGSAVVAAGYVPLVDWERVAAHRVDHLTVRAPRAQPAGSR